MSLRFTCSRSIAFQYTELNWKLYCTVPIWTTVHYSSSSFACPGSINKIIIKFAMLKSPNFKFRSGAKIKFSVDGTVITVTKLLLRIIILLQSCMVYSWLNCTLFYYLCTVRVVHSITIPAAPTAFKVVVFFEKLKSDDKGVKSKQVAVARGASQVQLNVKLELPLTLFNKKNVFEVRRGGMHMHIYNGLFIFSNFYLFNLNAPPRNDVG